MNRAETATLLTKIAAYDRRTLGEADVLAWQEVLDDLPLRACLDAVREHYRESRDWCMPADIVGRVRSIRAKRVERAAGYRTPLTVSRERWVTNAETGQITSTTETEAAWFDELEEVKRRVHGGEWNPAEYQAYLRSGLPIDEFDATEDKQQFLALPPSTLARQIPEGW